MQNLLPLPQSQHALNLRTVIDTVLNIKNTYCYFVKWIAWLKLIKHAKYDNILIWSQMNFFLVLSCLLFTCEQWLLLLFCSESEGWCCMMLKTDWGCDTCQTRLSEPALIHRTLQITTLCLVKRKWGEDLFVYWCKSSTIKFFSVRGTFSKRILHYSFGILLCHIWYFICKASFEMIFVLFNGIL